MLLKIIGSILIISASGFIGFLYSKDCSARPQQLREIQNMLQMLENEISFLSTPLSEAFERIYKSSNNSISAIFKSAHEYLIDNLNYNASEAWALAVRDNIKKTSLKEEDEEILVSFGKILGSSDVEGQIGNIRLTVNQLKMQEHKAEEIRKKNENMYRTLGVLGGIAIVILLL